MASSFQRYSQGIQPVTGMSEAGANIGKMYQQGIASFGDSLAKGLQQYNDNSAKNDILTSEAEALGQQIQMFQKQFGDSPEHKPFADSLQPYIDQLAKVPSMSLTQKMGAVTGVKAGFANIGQQLQVFELMRKERNLRDMNAARGGVKEFDEVTVPTAIIPSGKLPYFYDKSYTQNETEVIRLANEAKARGANVDIAKTLGDWRADFKASAMSRTDMPPAVKEALVKQLEASERVADESTWTTDWDKTNYDQQGEDVSRVMSSVQEQLAPAKAEVATATPEEKLKKAEELDRKATEISDKIAALNNIKNQDITDNTILQASLASIEKLNKELEGVKTERAKIEGAGVSQFERRVQKDRQAAVAQSSASLAATDKVIAEMQADIAKGISPISFNSKFRNEYRKAFIDSVKEQTFVPRSGTTAGKQIPLSLLYEMAINRPHRLDGFAPDFLTSAQGRAFKEQYEKIEKAAAEVRDEFGFSPFSLKGALTDGEYVKISDDTRKRVIDSLGKFRTEVVQPEAKKASEAVQNPALVDAALGVQKPKTEAQPEPTYTLTNQRNMALGTTTTQVATSIESKRNDMKNFFTKKYGYVPASFEESFKAIYPEANFKTMETPYGVFMHDGKDWKQVQMQQVKPASRKELAEEKAVSFGKLQPDSSIDINEFGELVPNSGVYVRGIFSGSPTDATKFRQQMLEGSNAKRAVGRLIEINDMVGESMPWNAKVWGEAKALLPQIKAGLRTDIIGVGTVSNYEQELINEVVANPTLFWSLESSDRAKLAVIMDKISNRLVQEPANHGLEVKVAGKTNAEMERRFRTGNAGKSKLELDFEARGGKSGLYMGGSTGAKLNLNLTNKIPDAFK